MSSATDLSVSLKADTSALVESIYRHLDVLADLNRIYALAARFERLHAIKSEYHRRLRRRSRRG